MLDTQLDVKEILKANPQVSAESMERIDSLVERLNRLGIQDAGYRLESPFSPSLRKVHDQCCKCRSSR